MVAGFKRVRSNVRTSIGHLGVFTRAVECGTICRRELHYCCLLVHRVNLICKSSHNNRSFPVEHLRRIQPSDVPLFIVARLAGALAATFLFRWFVPNLSARADRILIRQGR